MTMKRVVWFFCAGVLLLSGCDKARSLGHQLASATQEDTSKDQQEDIEKRTAKLSGEIVQAAFADPTVKAKQDAVWGKVFQEPETAKALQDLVSATMADPTVKGPMDAMMGEVMKDPVVVAKLKAIAASASSQAEIQEKIEKHVSGAMASPAVSQALDRGVEALVAAPEVAQRLGGIFEKADMSAMVGSALKDPDVVALSNDLDKRLVRVMANGKADAYFTDWTAQAKKDPVLQAAARDFANEAVAGLAQSDDLKSTLRGGFESARTRKILAAATADLLADPSVNADIRDFFKALFAGDGDPEILAKKADALFKNPMLSKRLQAAIVELLSSKIGAARLEKAVLSGMATPEGKKKLAAMLVALLKSAPNQ